MSDRPKNFGGRLVALVVDVPHDPPLSWRELDRLAGLAEGHTAPFAGSRARSEPKGATIAKIATALGARAAYLALGDGKAPKAAEVLRAVARARAQHAAIVATPVAACKR